MLFKFFIAITAVTNPMGKVPLWIRSAGTEDRAIQRRIASYITLTGGAILLLMLLFGTQILNLLSIDLASFKVGGGIVVLLLGVGMLHGEIKGLHVDQIDESDPRRRAKIRFREFVVPLAVPAIAGPGSMTTTMIYGARATGWLDYLIMAAILVGVCSVTYLIFAYSPQIRRYVGDTALDVQTRLFGLVLVAFAAQIMLEGLGQVYPMWLSPASDIRDEIQEKSNDTADQQRESGSATSDSEADNTVSSVVPAYWCDVKGHCFERQEGDASTLSFQHEQRGFIWTRAGWT
jgi:multiple antibiotic resistance protein